MLSSIAQGNFLIEGVLVLVHLGAEIDLYQPRPPTCSLVMIQNDNPPLMNLSLKVKHINCEFRQKMGALIHTYIQTRLIYYE